MLSPGTTRRSCLPRHWQLAALWLPLALSVAGATPRSPVKVGILAGHTGSWHSNKTCTGSSLGAISCNLQVYASAVEVAKAQGVELLVMPEAYALSPLDGSTHFEPLLAKIGDVPCSSLATSASTPQQRAISCAALSSGVAVAANVFACRDGGSGQSCPKSARRITELVFDGKGALLASYDKHHLFVNELLFVRAGAFHPTSFALLGRRWGIVICFEGVWPLVPGGNYSQTDEMVRGQNASALVWSIGGHVPMHDMGAVYAKRYGKMGLSVGVVATEDGSSTEGSGAASSITCPDGSACKYSDAAVATATTYKGKPYVRSATLL